MFEISLRNVAAPFDVDLDDDVLAAGETLEDRALGHAVEIAVNQRMLDEVAFFDLPLEIGTVEKEIMHAVDLTGSHWSRGRGHHVPGIRVDIAQLLDHRVLADARTAPK